MNLDTGTITPVSSEQVDVLAARIREHDPDAPALLEEKSAKLLRSMKPEQRKRIGANIRKQRAKLKAKNRRRRKLARTR